MGSYNTVQVVAYTAASIATDYVVLAPGYVFSLNSVAPAGGGGPSSGTSFTPASAISITVTGTNALLDLTTTGVTAASSYNSITVDARGRVTNAETVAGSSSGTSFTPTSEMSFGAPVAGNVLIGLPYTVTQGSGCSISFDKTGRVIANAASITTASVTGTWTSGVSSSDVQGLGSTWTVSRISSDRSILGNEVWASGMSVGSIVSASRISSSISILATEIWSSGVSAKASIGSFSYTSSSRTAMAVALWGSEISATSIIGPIDFTGQLTSNFRVENRTADPGSPTVGQVWLRTDL